MFKQILIATILLGVMNCWVYNPKQYTVYPTREAAKPCISTEKVTGCD
jgi:hypothetical protein